MNCYFANECFVKFAFPTATTTTQGGLVNCRDFFRKIFISCWSKCSIVKRIVLKAIPDCQNKRGAMF